MSSFEANLKTMPFAEQTILLRVFNSKDELMAVLPNFPAGWQPASSGQLAVA